MSSKGIGREEVTYEEYLKLEGLCRLYEESRNEAEKIQESIANILEAEDDGHNYYGHLSDKLWDHPTAKSLLDSIDVEIKEEKS